MATNWDSFKIPPIKEAIFSLTFSEKVEKKDISTFKEDPYIAKSFTKDREIKASNNRHILCRLDSPNDDKSLIIEESRLSFHIIKDYRSWDFSFNEFLQISKLFSQFVKVQCDIISVRFINLIIIPNDSIELSDYFSLYPTLPSEVPQSLQGFFLNITLPKDTMNANIIQTVSNKSNDGEIGIIIDIDIVKPLQNGLTNLVNEFHELREYKNDLFFNIITEKTKTILKNQ